jgi:uncharacterized protein (DUF1697 family)
MSTRIAFLRAVNLGRRRVSMARVVEVFEGAGFAGAWTYANSGNVVFGATGPGADLERTLEHELDRTFGFEITTFVRTATELRHAVAATPFAVSPGDTYFLTFLKSTLTAPKRRQLEGLTNDFDTLVVAGRTVHWLMHGKSTATRVRTKDWERVVGRHQSTSRNMTLLRQLVRKIDS